MTATNKFSFSGGAEVHVWRASLEADDAAVTACEGLLAAPELVKARRFHFERDRRRYTLARGLLRRLAGQYIGMDPAAVCFELGPQGKPRLAFPQGETFRFNLSHSGTQALYVFALGREVGIDLEAGERLGDDWLRLSKRIFSKREQAELEALPSALQRDAFLNGWTRKEAYLKATGQGLVNGLQEIEVTLAGGRPAAFWSTEIARKWSVFDLRSAAGMAAALVVEGACVAADLEIRALGTGAEPA